MAKQSPRFAVLLNGALPTESVSHLYHKLEGFTTFMHKAKPGDIFRFQSGFVMRLGEDWSDRRVRRKAMFGVDSVRPVPRDRDHQLPKKHTRNRATGL